MPATYVDFKPPVVETTRTYDLTGLAPDTHTTEAGGKRTLVIHPRTLVLRSQGVDPSTTISSISLEGRQVRKKDGTLGNSRLVSWRAEGWGSEKKPPAWILEIIEAEGLRYGR